jgi:hypothetical protein
MKRRLVLAAAASLASTGARAQTPERLRKVGVLIDGSAPHPLPGVLRTNLTGRGWVEGGTIAFDVRYADGQPARAAEQAAELVKAEVDIIVDPVPVAGPADFAAAFAKMAEARAGAVIIQGVFNSHRAAIVEIASRQRLPTMWFDRQAVLAGGLISLSANTDDIFQRAAIMADKVLKGAKPADLPVEQPAIFELVINLKAAKELGLTLPRSVQVQADELIE